MLEKLYSWLKSTRGYSSESAVNSIVAGLAVCLIVGTCVAATSQQPAGVSTSVQQPAEVPTPAPRPEAYTPPENASPTLVRLDFEVVTDEATTKEGWWFFGDTIQRKTTIVCVPDQAHDITEAELRKIAEPLFDLTKNEETGRYETPEGFLESSLAPNRYTYLYVRNRGKKVTGPVSPVTFTSIR